MTHTDRIPDLLARVDLDALVARHGGREARRTGGRTYFHCPGPGHDDRTPSFDTYQPANGGARRWACRSVCSRGGDAIDLVVWLTGCTKAQAIDQLASEEGMVERPSLVEPPSVAQWCALRGWGPWVASELGLTLVKDKFGRPRVRFPFRFEGGVPYHQDRAIDDAAKVRWLSPTGRQPIAYEAERLRIAHERGHVFILEGVTDVAAIVDVYSAPAAVGIPGVGAWRSSWAPSFKGLVVYVIGDNDEAGGKFRARVTADLQHDARSVCNVHVPKEFKDVADWRAARDPQDFDDELMAAVEAVAPGSVRMAG